MAVVEVVWMAALVWPSERAEEEKGDLQPCSLGRSAAAEGLQWRQQQPVGRSGRLRNAA